MAMTRTHDFLPRKRKADDASSSSSSNHWRHDVFLSFRGEDTRNSFTGHLYHSLKDAGIKAFIDENELKRGENITEELVQAIQASRISVIIFSTRYADSSWCLEELVQIMECRRTLGQKVFPVFYDVDPSHVRKQTGSFGDAFIDRHKDRDGDIVQRWIDALTVAANLSGWDLKTTADGHEAKLIKIITEEISGHLNNTDLHVADHEVGIDSRMQEIISYLSVGTPNDVRIVGIWGMGGIGKTAVAKALYNKCHHRFEASSFLADVRETMQKSGKVSLQQSLLSDINKRTRTEVGPVDKGINIIKNSLGWRRVFVVLDDVDKMEQLETLVVDRDSFGPGSRIIITTRDEQLLNELGVDSIYPARGMNEIEALELFSWHAFKSCCPNEGYLELSRSVVTCCGGLPLALKVLGSFLVKRSKTFWKSATEKLEKVPRLEIQEKLKVSYDGLNDDTERSILLDISCFFIARHLNYVKSVLGGSDFVLDTLIQRCLVTVDREVVVMHDLLRQMCSEIIRAKYRDSPGKWSRVWREEDAMEVLRDESGSEEIQGLSLHVSHRNEIPIFPIFRTEAFAKMKRLRLLYLSYVALTGNYKVFPNKIRWLHWNYCPLEFIPKDLRLGEAVGIYLERSHLKFVWEDSGVLAKLKYLNLSLSRNLEQLPDFSYLPNLEELVLNYCDRLAEVNESIGSLRSLSYVNLENCSMLKELPNSFYKIKSIRTLVLDSCIRFEKLGEDIGDMTSLEILRAENTAIIKLPSSIVKLKNLRFVWLGHGDTSFSSLFPLSLPIDLSTLSSLVSLRLANISFRSLPPCLSGLSKLEHLVLDSCKLTDDAMIHMELGSLSSLKSLSLDDNWFRTLPSFRGVSKLQSLSLTGCGNLHAIPDLPTSLMKFSANQCYVLEIIPDFSEMSNLELLSMRDCSQLVEVPGLQRSLKISMILDMSGMSGYCRRLTPAFRESILQAWNFIGPGGILLPSRSDIFKLLTWVNEGGRVNFQVPQNRGSTVIAFTLCFTLYDDGSVDKHLIDQSPGLLVTNHTKCISFLASSMNDILLGLSPYLWLGHFPNYKFNLECGDLVEVTARAARRCGVKKIGASLIWDTQEADYRTADTDWVVRTFSSRRHVQGSATGDTVMKNSSDQQGRRGRQDSKLVWTGFL